MSINDATGQVEKAFSDLSEAFFEMVVMHVIGLWLFVESNSRPSEVGPRLGTWLRSASSVATSR